MFRFCYPPAIRRHEVFHSPPQKLSGLRQARAFAPPSLAYAVQGEGQTSAMLGQAP